MKTRNALWLATVLLLGLVLVLPEFVPAYATGDFTITATPSDLGSHIIAGSRHNITINVTSTGGFSGTVNLSASTVSQVTTTFNPTSVTVSSGGFATSTLKLVFGDCPIGSPPVTVTGQSGTLSHTVNITWEGRIIC